MLQNYNGYKVLKLFLDNPEKGFRLREISRLIKLGLPSVTNYVKELKKEKLIIQKKEHEIKFWFGNFEGELFKKYKIGDSLISIEKSGLLDFLDEEYYYPTIILFGSVSLGENIKKSDLDLCIISEKINEINLKKFEKKLGKEIQLFIFNEKSFAKLRENSPELWINIINGITLRQILRFK